MEGLGGAGRGLDVTNRLLLALCFEAEFDESTHRFRARDSLFRRPLTDSGFSVYGQSQREDSPIRAAWRPTSSRRFSLPHVFWCNRKAAHMQACPGGSRRGVHLFPMAVDGLHFCGGVCCVSNKLTDLFPKARRFKRGNLSAIHPQQVRLLRPDRIVRAPLFGARVGCWAPLPLGSLCPKPRWFNGQRRLSEAELFALGSECHHRLTYCPQYPCTHLRSCVRAGKGLDEPVRDARRDTSRLVLL
jgi:hypothetical protein